MWKAAVLGLGLVVSAVPARAQEIYQWTDAHGGVHYSNTPTVGAEAAPTDGTRFTAMAGTGAADAASEATAAESASFSTDVSLRRNALERQLRITHQRLREFDGRLAALARARMDNSGGSAATGGLGTSAGDFRSEQEKALGAERDQVAERASALQSDYGKLREEVTARLGTTPDWWVDVRFDRR